MTTKINSEINTNKEKIKKKSRLLLLLLSVRDKRRGIIIYYIYGIYRTELPNLIDAHVPAETSTTPAVGLTYESAGRSPDNNCLHVIAAQESRGGPVERRRLRLRACVITAPMTSGSPDIRP